jgi:hypothetical protein
MKTKKSLLFPLRLFFLLRIPDLIRHISNVSAYHPLPVVPVNKPRSFKSGFCRKCEGFTFIYFPRTIVHKKHKNLFLDVNDALSVI